jgi:hypothetical protein
MRTIWKFAVTTPMVVRLPPEAQILTIQLQDNSPQMWVLLDAERPTTPRQFVVVGTGQPLPEGPLTYCGTFQLEHQHVVFHVFETQGA